MVARPRGRLGRHRGLSRRGSATDPRAVRGRRHGREHLPVRPGGRPVPGSGRRPLGDRRGGASGVDRARGRSRLRRGGRTTARDPTLPLPRGRAPELLRVGVRPSPRAVCDAGVVHEPDSPSPAGLRALVEADVRHRARLPGPGRPRAGAACRGAARRDDGPADRLPANPDRRAREAVHDLQVPNDARRRGARRWRGLGQCRRSTRDADRLAPAADAPGRASTAAERASGRHVDRRAAPRAARVHPVARGGRSLLGPASARQAGHHRLGAGPLRLCRRLREHGRQAVLRPLVSPPPEPGHRPGGVRQDVLHRPRPRTARAPGRADRRRCGHTREAPGSDDPERRGGARALSLRSGGERTGQADGRDRRDAGVDGGATNGAARLCLRRRRRRPPIEYRRERFGSRTRRSFARPSHATRCAGSSWQRVPTGIHDRS